MATTHEALQISAIVPNLTVDDLQKSIPFYEGLGFAVNERWEENGKLLGVMLRAGKSQIGHALRRRGLATGAAVDFRSTGDSFRIVRALRSCRGPSSVWSTALTTTSRATTNRDNPQVRSAPGDQPDMNCMSRFQPEARDR